MNNVKEDTHSISRMVHKQKPWDYHILDKENVILVFTNNHDYTMSHQRLDADNKLIEINRWDTNSYFFGYGKNETLHEELKLFKVEGGLTFNAVYNYQTGSFLIPQGVWDRVNTGYHNEILKKYNGFHVSFSIASDPKEDDYYIYVEPITNKTTRRSFQIRDGVYNAIINLDGTIRGNKLFKGNDYGFSEITKIIDLDNYESLEAFKEERKQICNDLRIKVKQEYYQAIKDSEERTYLDKEVEKILSLKK